MISTRVAVQQEVGTTESVVIQAFSRNAVLGPDNTFPTPLTLGDFDQFRLVFSTVEYGSDGDELAFENVAYNVTELAPVPLPATGLLLIGGLLGLCAARRSRTA